MRKERRKMKKLFILAGLLFGMFSNASSVSYTTFRKDFNILLSKKKADWEGDYYRLPKNVELPVVIDNKTKTITIGEMMFEFMDFPEEWNVSQTYRSVRYECIELSSLGKVYIYLIEYDKTENVRLKLVWYDIDGKSTELYSMKKKNW